MNQELDKGEVLNALNELHRINPSGPKPTIEAVEKYIMDVDADGSGLLTLRFKTAFRSIMSSSLGKK